MKRQNILLILSILLALPLVGCASSPNTEIDAKVRIAIDSLRNTSHNVDVRQMVEVLRPIPEGMTPDDEEWKYLPIDIHQEYHNKYTYSYKEGGERAFARELSAIYYDMEKISGDIIPDSLRYDISPKEVFFKNMEDGTVIIDEITIENEFNQYTSATYDDTNGVYSPILFDVEFINPFDFISYRDVIVKEDDTSKLTLINQKADYLAECYGTIGMNFITDNTINLDEEGNISSIDFYIEDEVEDNYTRKNTLSIKYDKENAVIDHFSPFINSNPELQVALDVLDNKKNFTYVKEFIEPYHDKVKGYFNENEVFFHHETTENDTTPYIVGDDYDYKVVKQEDGTYLCYEFTPDGVNFSWKVCTLSSSAFYVINTFEEIGPSFLNMNASIFKKTGEKTYEIEDLLLNTTGKYFDNQMLGVNSYALETSTSKLTITLNDQNMIDFIEAHFIFDETEWEIKFYIEDVGSTIVPSWSNLDLVIPL